MVSPQQTMRGYGYQRFLSSVHQLVAELPGGALGLPMEGLESLVTAPGAFLHWICHVSTG